MRALVIVALIFASAYVARLIGIEMRKKKAEREKAGKPEQDNKEPEKAKKKTRKKRSSM